MPRSIWKGAISFGLINIPVNLYSAESRQELRFNQLDRRTMTRVREKRVNEQTGEEVAYEDIVRGFDTGGGNYVVLNDQDFRQANPKATQAVNIIGFVNADEIDVTFFDKPYYLAPIGTGKKGYALLRAVLHETGRVAIAKVVIRTREYLCALFARGDVMVLEILRFGYELRDTSELDVPGGDLAALGLSQPEITMAEQLIEAMVRPWNPAEYKDEFRDDLLRVIEEKQSSGQAAAITSAQPAGVPGEGKVIDIMALLKRSVEEVRSAGGNGGGEAGVPSEEAGSKKKAAASRGGGKDGSRRSRVA
jgi:DNA end-binding protein Ku